MTRGREFGWAGLAVGIFALALALLPGWISPEAEPVTGWENGWIAWLGRRAVGLPPTPQPADAASAPSTWRQRIDATSAVLGFAALVLGILSFVRREDARLTGCCVGVAAGAIATQHPVAAIMIMIFAVLTSAVLARHG